MFDQVRPSVLDRTPTITFTKQYWRCIHDLLPLLLPQFYLLAYHFVIIVFKIGILVLERMITKVIIVDHLLLLGLFLLCLNFCHLVLSLCIFIWLRILRSSIEGLLLRTKAQTTRMQEQLDTQLPSSQRSPPPSG